jgi:hypothetical protein
LRPGIARCVYGRPGSGAPLVPPLPSNSFFDTPQRAAIFGPRTPPDDALLDGIGHYPQIEAAVLGAHSAFRGPVGG